MKRYLIVFTHVASLYLYLATQSTLGIAQAKPSAPQSNSAVSNFDPKAALQKAKSIYIRSVSALSQNGYWPSIKDAPGSFSSALTSQQNWSKLDLTIVKDQMAADLLIDSNNTGVIIRDRKTGIALASQKIVVFDGGPGAKINTGARFVVKFLSEARLPQATE